MPPVLSKQRAMASDALDVGHGSVLSAVPYVDELSTALMEAEEDGNVPSVVELLARYTTQRASAIAGYPLWVCSMSFNNEYGSSWPVEFHKGTP